MATKLRGIIPAMVTPMKEGAQPDEGGVRKLTQHLLAGGVCGLFPCGSTGEGPLLRDDDWGNVIRWVVNETASRVPVLAHIADAGTQRVIDRAKRAADLGADAVVSTLPYFFVHPGQEAIRFFEAVAGASELPFYIYNVPQRTQVPLTQDMFLHLAQHPNIHGVKDSAVDVVLHFGLIEQVRSRGLDFTILNGSEFYVGASVMMGGDGGLLGIGNVCPRLCVDLYEAAARGDIPAVRNLQPRVAEVTTIFFTPGGSAICSIKRALEMMGICGPAASHPFIPPPPEQDDHIRGILERNGLL